MGFSQRFQLVFKTFFIGVLVVFFHQMACTSFSRCIITITKTELQKWIPGKITFFQNRIALEKLIVDGFYQFSTPISDCTFTRDHSVITEGAVFHCRDHCIYIFNCEDKLLVSFSDFTKFYSAKEDFKLKKVILAEKRWFW